MEASILNYLLAFLEGFALILSPCILPILPILLSGGMEGGRSRPWGIILGFVLAFAFFTLFSRGLVQYFGINLDLMRQLAFMLIAAFGLVLTSDYLSEKFSLATQNLANVGNKLSTSTQQNGFASGLLLGSLISLIWAPCGGPILAAAVVQTATQKTSLQSFFTFFFFALGSVIPMIVITFLGRKILDHFSFLKTKSHTIRKIFGIIIILSAIAAEFSGIIVNFSPMLLAPNVLTANNTNPSNQLIGALNNPYPAPSIQNDGIWLNSAPLSLNQLKGKVILIDFWTYSCINCIRTLPYLKDWYKKYKKDGFIIIGVHSPEFEFEKNIVNVENAVKQDGIQYPIVQDNNYVIWSNYENHYWPAHYLIDKNGKVVYQHFGEGNYAETEHNIQILLGLKSKASLVNNNFLNSYTETPETYLGYRRANTLQLFQELIHNKNSTYNYPEHLAENHWALQGFWKIKSQKITSTADNSSIKINFNAAEVYIVAGSVTHRPIQLKINLNGKSISNQEAGKDVHNGILNLADHTIYQVVKLKTPKNGTLELIATQAGAEFYTFTFGG